LLEVLPHRIGHGADLQQRGRRIQTNGSGR
jgi:hypothetical protein